MGISPFGFDRLVGSRNVAGKPEINGSRASHIKVPARRAVVNCAAYVDGRCVDDQRDYKTALDYVRKRGKGFVWIGLFEPDGQQMADIAEYFGLHELVVEDASQGMQRPKLEVYDECLVLNMRTVDYQPHDSIKDASQIVATGDILVITAPDFVMTVRHGNFGGLAHLRQEMEGRPEFLALGPSAVTHAVADHVVDAYVKVADEVERDVEELESVVFAPEDELDIEHIYLLKREVLELKHTITPLATPLRRLYTDHFQSVHGEIRHYFRDVADHHILVAESVVAYDERLSSLVSAAIARAGNQQNQDMRRISAWVGMCAVPTMIAGIYGMNFENMPELSHPDGYFIVLGVMVVSVLVLFVLFRRNKWL